MKRAAYLFLAALMIFEPTFVLANSDDKGTKTSTAIDDFNTFKSDISEENNTKLKAPMLNLFETTEWSLFIKEFEMTLNFHMCCKPGNALTCAFGVKAHMIEPIGYMETTMKPLYFPFADLDLGGQIIKGNMPYEMDNGETPRGTAYDAHFVYVPIMGLIFKKRLEMFCFHEGNMVIPYLSEFDPSWKIDAYYSKLIPHMIMMFTPQGLISAILDCISTEVVNAITMFNNGMFGSDKTIGMNLSPQSILSQRDQAVNNKAYSKRIIGNYSNKVRTQLNNIRDTMYHVDGCYGFSTVGGYVDGIDPIIAAAALFHGIMGLLHGVSALSPMPFLYKQTNAIFNTADFPDESSSRDADSAAEARSKLTDAMDATDTMCRWKEYPLPIPSQYLLQLAYPTVASAKEVGASGLTVSTAHNIPGAMGAVFTVWVRRDYYAFAYFCGKNQQY